MRRGRQGRDRHNRERENGPKHKPLGRKVHVDGDVWTWRYSGRFNRVVSIVSPDGEQRWNVAEKDFDAEFYWNSWQEEESQVVRPSNIRNYIEDVILNRYVRPQLDNNYRRLSSVRGDSYILRERGEYIHDMGSHGWLYGKGIGTMRRFSSRRVTR